MDKIINASEIIVTKFEKENYANEISKKINTLCFSNGKINLEFKNNINLEIKNNILIIDDIEREINCEIENVKLNKNKFTIEKNNKIIVS